MKLAATFSRTGLPHHITLMTESWAPNSAFDTFVDKCSQVGNVTGSTLIPRSLYPRTTRAITVMTASSRCSSKLKVHLYLNCKRLK